MRFLKPVVLLLCFLSLSTAAFAEGLCAPAGTLSFPITLNGSQFGGQGSGTAFGGGFVTLNPGNNTATLQLNTIGLGPNLSSATLMNNGASVLPFFNSSNVTSQNGVDGNGNINTTVTLTQDQMNAILANPSAFSLNIATGEFPQGAISGTLINNRSFSGSLSGSNVVGSTGATAGSGAFSANIAANPNGNGSTLFYSFTPSGIGNSFTGLSLNQGGLGAAGTPFLTLTNGGTLTNGRFTGSVPLTTAQAQQLMTNPNGFFVTANTSGFPNGAVRAQLAGTQNELWFPVAGSVRGALGNQWTTDIRVYNASGTAPATVTMELFPAGQNNATASGTMSALGASTMTVNGHTTNVLNNVTQALFSTFSGIGALRITSDQPVVAVERIYDLNASNGANSANVAAAAQPILARTMCDAVSRGLLVGITSGVNGSTVNAHSNIGFFNPNPVAVTVQLNANSSQGSALGTTQSLVLQPFQLTQMPFTGTPGTGIVNASQDISDAVLSFQSSAPIFAYSSVVNNSSGDTHVTFARQDLSSPAIAQSDVAAIVNAANMGEVQEGQVALTRASSAVVQQFAQQMITDHTNALAQAQSTFATAGITASSNNPTAQFLQAQTQQEIALLNTQSGTTFDRTYMQEQVNDHQKVLQMIDAILLPSAAATPQVTTLLQQMRATVAQHLATAQTILTQIP
jgi:putative membrane protein